MSGLIGALAAWLNRLWMRQVTRRALTHLDERLLRDVGVSVDQAARESAKRPWQH